MAKASKKEPRGEAAAARIDFSAAGVCVADLRRRTTPHSVSSLIE